MLSPRRLHEEVATSRFPRTVKPGNIRRPSGTCEIPLATIFSAARTVDLLCHMRQAAIEPKWMQAVQSYCGDPAKLVLVKGVQGGRPGLDVASPLVVYERDGRYTESVQEMMRP